MPPPPPHQQSKTLHDCSVNTHLCVSNQSGRNQASWAEVICASFLHPRKPVSSFVLSGQWFFSWPAQDIFRELTSGMLAGPHLCQSLILIHLPGGNCAVGRPSTSLFQSCGDFACYTAGWQEKQALGFIRVRWAIFLSLYMHLQVIIICELMIWQGCDVRLVGVRWMVGAETKRM